MSGRDLALDLYNAFKGGRKTFISKNKPEVVRDAADPKPIGELIDQLVTQREWKDGLSEGEIFVRWREVVGDENCAASISNNGGEVELREELREDRDEEFIYENSPDDHHGEVDFGDIHEKNLTLARCDLFALRRPLAYFCRLS